MASCYKCGKQAGDGKAELRPYGPGGQLVCFTCAFDTPEMKAQTESAFQGRLNAIEGPAILTPNGPVPLTDPAQVDGTGYVLPPLNKLRKRGD